MGSGESQRESGLNAILISILMVNLPNLLQRSSLFATIYIFRNLVAHESWAIPGTLLSTLSPELEVHLRKMVVSFDGLHNSEVATIVVYYSGPPLVDGHHYMRHFN